MYGFSRAMYRELSGDILAGEQLCGQESNQVKVLRACEAAVDRLATDAHYFAKPARSLFREIRIYFPMSAQLRVLRVVERYMDAVQEYLARLPKNGFDINGNPLQCRASTRRGSPCQRMPLAHNGYCPSHQHLAVGEDRPAWIAA